MAYEKTNWQDRVVERPRTFSVINNPDGTITLIPAPGVVEQEGTPVNAMNLNKSEQGISDAHSALGAHAEATAVHSATSAATANRILIRDAQGRAKVAAPVASDDIAIKSNVDVVQTNLTSHEIDSDPHTQYALYSELTSHANLTAPHSATAAATANRIMLRDASGRAKVAAPNAADDVARRDTVDALKGDVLFSLLRESRVLGGEDGDVIISADTNLPRRLMCYNNLTVNASRILTGNGPGIWIVGVKGTLTLNGTIKAVGVPGGHSTDTAGDGGQAGGCLIVIARQIVGAGTLSTAGTDGADSLSNPTGMAYPAAGTDGCILGMVLGKGASNNGGIRDAAFSTDLLDVCLFGFPATEFSTASAGSGAAGEADNSASDGSSIEGGGGGAGVGADGGAGGRTGSVADYKGAGGGGGGGGGFLGVASLNAIPALSLLANGGNGGNGRVYTGYRSPGGGGGGGGYILAVAPSSSAAVNVQGGAIGVPYGDCIAAQPGGAGLARFVAI